jgi:hypothetical protein
MMTATRYSVAAVSHSVSLLVFFVRIRLSSVHIAQIHTVMLDCVEITIGVSLHYVMVFKIGVWPSCIVSFTW